MSVSLIAAGIFVFTNIVFGAVASAGDRPENDVVKLKENIRGSRYGEILAVNVPLNDLKATVYSTFGCNDCPEEQWENIDVEKVKAQLKARKILLNGPRFF